MGIANLVWDTPAGSTGVLVEYRKQTDTDWIIPNSPPNPTMSGSYPIYLEDNVKYWVRLSSSSFSCASGYIIKEILATADDICCPPGYTMSPDESYCYQEITTAATPPASAVNSVAVVNTAYSTCGSYIYDPGWNLDGTGPSTQINLLNAFWVNGSGACGNATTTTGPMNRTALWSPTYSDGQELGFSVCVNLPTTKTYYIGMGADNYSIIKIDGTVILQQDATALGIQYGVGIHAAFKVWHIYPVELSAGPHYIEMIGHNITIVAAIACEIYNATPAEIAAATSYADLGSKLIFSSKDERTQPIFLGSGGVGYSCPAGYALSLCDGPEPICKQILTTPTISC